jgi:bifunctional DNase/RNase
MNNNTEPFELIECELSQIVLENQNEYVVGIIAGDKEIGIPINGYDGTLLTFTDSGCADNAHIYTIHQIFLKFKKDCKFSLSRVIIEAKYGDVIYCRLHWEHPKKSIYNVVSIGDALILQSLTDCKLFIAKNVLDQFEDFDSEGYMQSFED